MNIDIDMKLLTFQLF